MNIKFLAILIAFIIMLSTRPLAASVLSEEALYVLFVEGYGGGRRILEITLDLYKPGVGEYRYIGSRSADRHNNQDQFTRLRDVTRGAYPTLTAMGFRLPRGSQFAIGLRVTESNLNGFTAVTQVCGIGQSTFPGESTVRAVRLFEFTANGVYLRQLKVGFEWVTVLTSPSSVQLGTIAP